MRSPRLESTLPAAARRCASLLLLLCACIAAAPAAARGPAVNAPRRPILALLGLRVVQALPHDPEAFTQGFYAKDGLFYESIGHYGASELRVVEPKSGRVLRRRRLPDDLFGEGLAPAGPKIIQLTWKSGRALLWDGRTLGRAGEANLGREAWGLAAGPETLYLSDGSERISLLSPTSMAETGSIVVRDGTKAVSQLNELEYVRGYLLANIWFEDSIAVIEPETGRVSAWIDLAPLRPLLGPDAGVANGIAWDGERLYVTGKNWDKVFEIEVPDAPWERAPAPH
ncbi:glutaminyl-peptide cyclotransferase [Paucidesulfovibrio longus]|uniref:glutaminyl-peptide cyclotransferase n=1 Tax=Paucidesulfovibrio longus TaxID=889 RepID=UPI0003B41E5F|nr:glutaminyl-peptide cyclotransferase [Paucidesulfovibrio longus]